MGDYAPAEALADSRADEVPSLDLAEALVVSSGGCRMAHCPEFGGLAGVWCQGMASDVGFCVPGRRFGGDL